MQKKNKNIIGYSLKLLLIACLLMNGLVWDDGVLAVADDDKKAIILILDEISLEELIESNTPNLDSLIDQGAIGFMNTRAKSSVANRGSRYLSLGMGVRTLGSTRGGWAFGRDEEASLLENKLAEEGSKASDLYSLYTGKETPDGEIINVAIGDIDRRAYKTTPNNEIGLLGMKAREAGITVGLVGNGDTNRLSREASMLAMDERGVIPLGYVDGDLLGKDKTILGGKLLNPDRMEEEVDRILDKTDLLFLDYGDTSRIESNNGLALDHVQEEQKLRAIERGDSFLGRIMDKLDLDQTLFMLVSPNPSSKMIGEGNFGVSPVVLAGGGVDQGLLTSKTTRREGLVTNFDFAPTLLDYFEDGLSSDFIGESMKVVKSEDPLGVLTKNYSDYLYLRKFRSVFHWAYIILTGLTILGLYIRRFTRFRFINKNLLAYMGMTVMAIPLTMMTVSLWGYRNIVLDLAYVFIGAFLIGYILNKFLGDKLKTMMAIGLLTSALLLVDSFIIRKLMIISPLGSDAIAGGRFYGVGNDYMGILIGSSLLGIFILYERLDLSKGRMLILLSGLMGLIIVALSPFVGANMGGTLSAMLVLLMGMSMVMEKKISLKKLVLVMGLVVVAILVVAGLDIMFNPNPTHAGKAIEALFTGGGFDKLFEIISIKLRQVFWNIAYASWNIILFLELALLGLLYKFKRSDMTELREEKKKLFKGFGLILLASLAIFLFNDTGTIAAALILIYVFVPLGLLLNKLN